MQRILFIFGKRSITIRLLWIFFYVLLSTQGVSGQSPWYLSDLSYSNPPEIKLEQPIVIAVVDDGFRLSHASIREFLYQNENDIPGNRMDEDGNGFIDDHFGWDVSDNDPDVSLPTGRENTFYHGTFICGVITHLLQQSFGPKASEYFKILPVKALSDQAQSTYLKDGYKGIAYAIAQKPDIIVCAWNGGFLSPEEDQILKKARDQGIAILASAGNFYNEKAAPPASHPDVMAVAALDSSLQKLPRSNYGQFIDLAGPGQGVIGASSMNDESVHLDGESSAAVATLAACFAQLKALSFQSSPELILGALKNTATPIDQSNSSYAGKLGAGFPNLEKAKSYLLKDEKTFNSLIPEGVLYSEQMPEKTQMHEWKIKPTGDFKGIWLEPEVRGKFAKNSQLSFFDQSGHLVHQLTNETSESKIFIPGKETRIVFEQTKKRPVPAFQIDYFVETIDSSTLYCQDIRYYELEKSQFSDGSEKADYANTCDCKWQISVPPGQRIRIRFKEFDTQAKVDFVYLFDGESTVMRNIIAKFSGPNIPPEVISRTNKVLVWFVTDHTQTGNGWTLEYEAVGGG